MTSLQITHIHKVPRDNPHEGIQLLGNPSWGTSQKVTRAHMVQMIEARTHQFFTSVNGRRAEVEVVRQQGREPYVRSVPDNTRVDNLLSLPEIYF